MTKGNSSLFGRLTKTHGYQGKIVLKASLSEKVEIEIMESVFLKIEGILVPFFIEEFSETSFPFYITKFENIDDDISAKELLGRDVYIPDNCFKQNRSKEIKLKDFVAFSIKDQHDHLIGEIVNLLEIPGNSLFVVDFNGREILIPVQNQLIVDINWDDKIIKMSIPDGITEM